MKKLLIVLCSVMSFFQVKPDFGTSLRRCFTNPAVIDFMVGGITGTTVGMVYSYPRLNMPFSVFMERVGIGLMVSSGVLSCSGGVLVREIENCMTQYRGRCLFSGLDGFTLRFLKGFGEQSLKSLGGVFAGFSAGALTGALSHYLLSKKEDETLYKKGQLWSCLTGGTIGAMAGGLCALGLVYKSCRPWWKPPHETGSRFAASLISYLTNLRCILYLYNLIAVRRYAFRPTL